MKVYYRDSIGLVEISSVNDVTIAGNDVYITAGDRDITIQLNQLAEIMNDEEEQWYENL